MTDQLKPLGFIINALTFWLDHAYIKSPINSRTLLEYKVLKCSSSRLFIGTIGYLMKTKKKLIKEYLLLDIGSHKQVDHYGINNA